MPKAGRGRGPTKAKKRTHRPELRSFAPAPVGAVAGVTGAAVAAGVADRPAGVPGTAPRRGVPQQGRRTFSQTVVDYSYVAGDLRRIGLLAGSLVALLVVLSFVIR